MHTLEPSIALRYHDQQPVIVSAQTMQSSVFETPLEVLRRKAVELEDAEHIERGARRMFECAIG